ncbi:hypothetical protein KJ969_01445 [Patescibacteria group bacterium]|nr:hypothetical protein [Patescibacteria group bacterium]
MQEKNQGPSGWLVLSLLAFMTLFVFFVLTKNHGERIFCSIGLVISLMLVIAAGIRQKTRSGHSRLYKQTKL